MSRIYLDTTIQADRYYEIRSVREKIKEKLNGHELLSSTYVLGELKSNFLKDLTQFYVFLSDPDVENYNEALVRFQRYAGYHNRAYGRVLKVLNRLNDDGNMNKNDLLARLDIIIETIFERRFYKGVSEVVNNTGCVRAQAKPVKEGYLWNIDHGCRKKQPPACNIVDYVNANLKEMSSFASTNIARQMKMVLDQGRAEPTVLYGRKCWKTGDAMITLEAPRDSVIYTTNTDDFRPLVQVTGHALLEK